MKKFGTITNLDIQPRAGGYDERFNCDRRASIPKKREITGFSFRQNYRECSLE